MKQLSLSSFVCVLAFVASSQPEQLAIKLTGIIDLPGFKRALLEIQEKNHPPKWPDRAALAEGQRRGQVEVVKIDSDKAAVFVRDAGKETSLTFENRKAADISAKTSNPTVRLDEADFAQTLDLFAEMKGRTVLRHPSLPATSVSFKTSAPTLREAIKALEAEFLDKGIAVIPDGEKFVMVVPAPLAKTIVPRPVEVAAKAVKDSVANPGEIIPSGSVYFAPVGLDQVLPIYSELIGRKYVPQPFRPQGAPIHFRSTTPLTKAELVYALETLLAWDNVTIVLNDDKTFTAISASAPKLKRID